ncbi:MAG: terminase small subunit, partial [Clostridium sp.]|nr:terminase small subunit [Clostridium sp.]
VIKDSNEVDGTLISEISNNDNGVKIKLLDRMKALEWISNHMNIATEEQKAKVEKIKAEIELLKVRKEKAEEEW